MMDHDVQLVRIFIERLSPEDMERFSSGDIEAAIQHLDDRAVIDEAGDLPYSGRHVGPRGLPLPPAVDDVSVTESTRSKSL
jgi:hypothetical protein